MQTMPPRAKTAIRERRWRRGSSSLLRIGRGMVVIIMSVAMLRAAEAKLERKC